MAIIKTITSKGDFIVKLLSEFKDSIKNIYFFDNKQFVITNGGIFDHNDKSILDFKKSVDKTPFEMCEVMGEDPLITYLKKGIVEFFSLDKTLISTIKAEAMFEYNGIIYTINSEQLIEHEFQKFGKLIHTKRVACNILPSYEIFKNIIIQDDFMKCHLAIPFEKGKCINKRIQELDGKRIIDAKHDSGICVIMSEYQGKYTRSIIQFNNTFSDYEISQEEIDNLYSINFIILPNKMCILIDDEKLFLFKDIKHKKELTVFPFDVSMKLYHNNMQVLFVDDNKLYSVTMK